MKITLLIAGLAGLAASGCAEDMNAGNPDGTPYAGSPASVYSSADNPPKAVGTVTYDPATQPAPADSGGIAGTMTPTPGNGVLPPR